MIGGKVVEIILETKRVFLNVQDKTYPKDRCGIYVIRNKASEAIEIGDECWWQGAFVMWTPQNNPPVPCGHRNHIDCHRRAGLDYDIRIPRASYSGVDHPLGKDVLDLF